MAEDNTQKIVDVLSTKSRPEVATTYGAQTRQGNLSPAPVPGKSREQTKTRN